MKYQFSLLTPIFGIILMKQTSLYWFFWNTPRSRRGVKRSETRTRGSSSSSLKNQSFCWIRFSTILHWSGIWLTMLAMLSSEVLTSVGPNTMARLRGSIWTRERRRCQRRITRHQRFVMRPAAAPCSFHSCQKPFWDEHTGISVFRNGDRATRGPEGDGETGQSYSNSLFALTSGWQSVYSPAFSAPLISPQSLRFCWLQ